MLRTLERLLLAAQMLSGFFFFFEIHSNADGVLEPWFATLRGLGLICTTLRKLCPFASNHWVMDT
jgi:hypothetical protein